MVRRKWLTLMVTVNQVGVVSHPQPPGALGSPLCTLYSVRLSTSRGVLDTRNISTAVQLLANTSKCTCASKEAALCLWKGSFQISASHRACLVSKDPTNSNKVKDPFERGKVSLCFQYYTAFEMYLISLNHQHKTVRQTNCLIHFRQSYLSIGETTSSMVKSLGLGRRQLL